MERPRNGGNNASFCPNTPILASQISAAHFFRFFSCSLIIGWTECKRQYEQRGSMPVGAWWRSAAKCIVVNQQLHGSKSKHEWQCWKTSTITRFSAGQIQKYPLSGKQRTDSHVPLRTKLNIVFAFFLLRTFEWTAIYTTVFTKCPHNTHEALFAAMVRGQNVFQWENHVEEMEVWPPFAVTENGYLKKLARFQKNKEFGNFNQNLKFGKPTSGKNCKKLWLPHHCGDWCLLGAQLSDGFSFIFPVAWTEKSKSAKWNQIQEKTIPFYDHQKKKTNPFQVPFELKSWPEVGWKKRQWIEIPNLHVWFKCPSRRKKACQNDWSVDLWALFGAGKKHLYVTGASASLEKNNLKRECWKKPLEKIERYTPLLTPVSAFLKNIQPFDRRFFQEY